MNKTEVNSKVANKDKIKKLPTFSILQKLINMDYLNFDNKKPLNIL